MRVIACFVLTVNFFAFAQEENQYFWQQPVLDAIEGLEEFVRSVNPRNVEEFRRDAIEYFENMPERMNEIEEFARREYQKQLGEYRLTIYNECFDLPDIDGDESRSLRFLMRFERIREEICVRARDRIRPHVPFAVQ